MRIMESEDNKYKKQLERARSLCARQEKCIRDIQNKLGEWGVQEKFHKAILDKLIDERYIDEDRYARSFVREKFFSNQWGKIKIRQILKGKMIPEEIITIALKEIPGDDYIESLKKLLLRKKKSIKARNQFDLRGRLQRFAYGRGFEPDIIETILNDVVKNPDR